MKLSPAFSTLLHIVWSGLFGLIIAGGTAAIQYNATNGINIEQDAVVFALTMLTGLGSTLIAIWSNIQKSPALQPAEAEVANQLAQSAHARIDDIVTWLQAHTQAHASMSTPTPVIAPQSAVVPSSLRPTTLQPISTPVAPNTPPPNAVQETTVPGMPATVPNV